MCAAVALAAVSPAPASMASSPPDPTLASATVPPTAAPTPTVTLVTGDKVVTTRGADGTPGRLVQGPDGRYTGFETHRSGKDTYVYPDSALPYVAAGLLDRELFNVTRLLADGYDDAHTDRLPLIVTYTDAAARVRNLPAPRGARKVRALDSIQGAALGADRSDAFWTSITATSGGAGTAGRSAGERPRLTGGIAKVWLDGKVQADLAESTAQISAPQVWASGNTGEGVDVAVLDTGVDADHPDLAGRIATVEDFVPGESAVDGNGHGTHVASSIAGTGAASDGKEKGVAPGARLHIGKVLSDDGAGQDSWILAGMEWAARDQHAKIISMSLGGQPTDGTDPLSTAVNNLSEQTGALFTIAAGNAGPDAYSVGAPGVADEALTVGAVDGSDALADFSSRGPRAGDGAVKPDLTAPGVAILAARSHYTQGSGPYQTLSGTSMATPHVAGAAALLAAAHPGWTARQLKNALVSTAKATPGRSPFEGGTGRVDSATTTAATVFATGSVAFGYHSWPTPPGTTADREVTYTNNGGAPVTLDLQAGAANATDGAFTVSVPRLTVPAHGTAAVTVRAHYDGLPTDPMVGGFLTATDPSGSVHTRTSLSVGKQGERHRLTLAAKDRGGRPIGGTVILTGRKMWLPVLIDDSGTIDLRLPPGSYTAWLDTPLEGAHGPHSVGLGLLAVTDIDLSQDRTAVLDGTRARQVEAVTPRPSTPDSFRLDAYRGFAEDDWSSSSRWSDTDDDSLWAVPTGRKVAEGEFVLGTRWRLAQPALTVAAGDRAYDDLRVHRGAQPLPAGRHRLDAVFAGDGTAAAYASLDVRGKAALVRRTDAVPVEEQAAAAHAAGARLLLVVHDGDGRLQPWNDSPWAPADPAPLPVATLTRDEGEQLITRTGHERVRLDVTSHPTTEYVYDLTHDYRGAVPADLTHRAEQRDLARVDVSFRNFRAGRALETRDDVTTFGGSALNPSDAPAQGTRTDWVTAGEPWSDRAQIPSEQQQYAPEETYRAGTVHGVQWFGPVQRPRLLDGDAPVRQDDTLYVSVPGWGDSGTAHLGGTYGNFGADNVVGLYQGDKLLARTSRYQLSMTVKALDPAPLPYRLVSDNARDAWPGPYSTRTHTAWGFSSRAGEAGAQVQLPLIQLDYGIGTDAAGRAPRHTGLTVTASHLSGSADTAAIGEVGLEMSYDDGATWHRTALQHRGTGWHTRLDAPRDARYVTLRTTARDARGNTVEQSITRAFGLK
ncbi:S8 family serine peptidase [Streptomyces sp. MMS24-I2-30]|uniref:S8 family serine peptidase n=1 Tax=Streptomyces sp. MMS24-I2-30 TaxID=3351564 RepID=UPI003896D674